MNGPITVVISQPAITISGNLTMPTFVPFTFTCTVQGQTIFGLLPITPQTIWVYITGSAQNQAAGDFTISNLNIITSQGCNLGDTIYGIIQT